MEVRDGEIGEGPDIEVRKDDKIGEGIDMAVRKDVEI